MTRGWYFLYLVIAVAHGLRCRPQGELETYQEFSTPSSFPTFQQRNHTFQPTSIWGSLRPPYPTNNFFTNIGLNVNYFPIAPLPYHIKLDSSGISASFATWRNVNPAYITLPFTANLIVNSVEGTQQYIDSYDPFSLTMKWYEQSGSGTMTSPVVRGSPYITMEYNDLTPVFRSSHAILSVNNNWGSGPFTGDRFVIYMNNGMTWKIYSVNGTITLNKWSNQLQSSTRFRGTLRAALIQQPQDEAILDAGSQNYPIGASLSYSFNGSNANIKISWNVRGPCPGSLLMMALPHHIDTLIQDNDTQTVPITYKSIKGNMVGISGQLWTLKEKLTNIKWFSPEGIDPQKYPQISQALSQDKGRRCTLPDPYNAGKVLSSMGRLALIADEMGDNITASSIRSNMISDIDPWLLGTNWNSLRYESSWGGLCSSFGLSDTNGDYGQGWYNDHHFHYGYFLYAAAVIGKENKQWLNSRKSKLMEIVRDIANPNKQDPYFPFSRHKDWYDGHSWASGLFPFGDSKNQESSSESVNAYYGLYLLGESLGDTQLSNWGRLLLATEIRSVKKYWHIPSSSDIYESPFKDNKIVGVLWSMKVDYSTFFGANEEYIHCIQMMPFTPITEELLDADWVREEYPILSVALTRTVNPIGEGWKGFVYMDHAIIAKEAAWQEVQGLNWYDNGNSRTNTLYWVATRPGNKKRMQVY